MLKYVAICQVVDRSTLGIDAQQLKRVSCLTYKSPALDNEVQAKSWLETKHKAYPEKYYLVHHCVISFELSETENVEKMLSNLIKMF